MSEEQVGKYKILSELGKGSMGVVYLAEDPEIGRQVAIKTLRSVYLGEDAAGQEALKRFRQESRSAGRLKHPNIITIFEAGRSQAGSPYIVMEFIDGKSLEDLLSEIKVFEPLEALHLLAQVASAIDYAHTQDIIHRDIKPSNVILDQSRRPYLLDFGVAKLADTSLTPAGTVVGTPSYMAPEQIRGETLTSATDRFAFAVLAYEMLTGVRPFPGSDFMSVASNIIHSEPLSFEAAKITLDPRFEPVLRVGLSKDRALRPQSCIEFVKALAKPFDVPVDQSGVLSFQQGLTLVSIASKLGGASAVPPSQASVETSSPESSSTDGSDLQATVMGRTAFTEEKKSEPAVEKKTDTPRHVQSIPTDSASQKETIKEGNGKGLALIGAGIFLILIAGLVYYALGGISKKEDGEEEIAAEESSVSEASSEISSITRSSSDSSVLLTSAAPGCGLGTKCTISESTPASAIGFLDTDKVTEASALPTSNGNEYAKLILLLSDPNQSDEELIKAIAASAEIPYSESIPVLLQLVSHPSYKVRIAVLKLFTSGEKYRTREVFRAIVERLEDKEFLVRGFSAKFLASLNNSAGRKILEDHLVKEKEPAVRKVIEAALAKPN